MPDLTPEALDQLEAIARDAHMGGSMEKFRYTLGTATVLALIAEVRELRAMLTEADRQLDVEAKHAALAEGEHCDICTHRQTEELCAEIEMLHAKVQQVWRLTDHDEGYQHNGHPANEGEPECPGCWTQGILAALAGRE